MCAVVHIVANAFWLMLPAYIANSAAALFGGIFGKTPIDMRKNLGNKRILGEGKTYEGFFSGVFAGLLVGMLQEFIAPLLKMPEFTPAVLLCLQPQVMRLRRLMRTPFQAGEGFGYCSHYRYN